MCILWEVSVGSCGVLGWLSDLRSFSFSPLLLCAQNNLSCPHAAALSTEGPLASPSSVLVCDRATSRCWGCEGFVSVSHLGLSSDIALCCLGKEQFPNFSIFPLLQSWSVQAVQCRLCVRSWVWQFFCACDTTGDLQLYLCLLSLSSSVGGLCNNLW